MAVYDKANSEARAVYDKARSEARAVYYKASSEAWAVYDKADSEARAVYTQGLLRGVGEGRSPPPEGVSELPMEREDYLPVTLAETPRCARCEHSPFVHARSGGRPATSHCFQTAVRFETVHHMCPCPAYVAPAEAKP